MAQKPSIPKGTRDFGPVEMAKRNYIFNTINKYVGDFLKKEVDNYLHIHKDVAEILENKIKESERERIDEYRGILHTRRHLAA